ncbi:MAG: PLD nuclease N-terminal domain-containing protein, partial [Butyricicoccaceae bacterium]
MKKSAKSISAKLINRTSITVLLILIQAGVLISLLTRLSEGARYVDTGSRLLALIVALYIINRPDNAGFKLATIVPILTFPIVGVPFYLLFGGTLRRKGNAKFIHRYNHLMQTV